LISAASPFVINIRNLIISLAARHRLPAIYPFPFFVAHGALICFGPDPIDPHRKAAGYEAATKFELVINLKKTAKALGLAVPPTLLDRAAQVIE
jgi:putative ABC transport system substrate-binding protein